MPNKLMTVDGLLFAHDSLRFHVRLVMRQIADDKSEKKGDTAETVSTPFFEISQPDLKGVIVNLAEDVNRHLAFEESLLPGLIGEIMMEFIRNEHRKISHGIEEISSLFRDKDFPDTPAAYQEMQKMFQDWVSFLLEHCETEDTILKLFKRNFYAVVPIGSDLPV
jgi:hemerythrin